MSAPLAAVGLYGGTLSDSYVLLLLATAVAGGAFAAMYRIGTTILGDTSNPARWYGVKIAAEAFPGPVLLLVLPSTATYLTSISSAYDGWQLSLGSPTSRQNEMIFLSQYMIYQPTSTLAAESIKNT